MSSDIRILGPRDRGGLVGDYVTIDTTSRSSSEWTTGLSPFHLGPCPLYAGYTARRMENAWQFAKVYPEHLDADGNPSDAYWRWARAGWHSDRAVRYPRGKGAKPAYLLWEGRKLDYIAGRLQVYWPLYRDAVARTPAFARLREIVASGRAVALFDFDGFDHAAAGVPLSAVLVDTRRPMGHAFVLKAMLLYGSSVKPDQVMAANVAPLPFEQSVRPQLDLFSQAPPVSATSMAPVAGSARRTRIFTR